MPNRRSSIDGVEAPRRNDRAVRHPIPTAVHVEWGDRLFVERPPREVKLSIVGSSGGAHRPPPPAPRDLFAPSQTMAGQSLKPAGRRLGDARVVLNTLPVWMVWRSGPSTCVAQKLIVPGEDGIDLIGPPDTRHRRR
jgi:hypothetical protein